MGQGNNNGGRSKGVLATLGVLALAAIGSYLGIDGLGGTGTGTGSDTGGDAATATKQVASSGASASGLDECALDTLPDEAEDTADDILAGGPYDHPDNDNKRFGNYEGVLPKESKNYYREYTVDTPGLNHRGARRIVTGGGTDTDPEVWYYTDDHYESFCEIPDAEG